MFVGVGAARVRDMFEVAAKQAPSVIFIDELDAVGRKRGSGIGAAHDEREQTLNQILVCMDGFEAHDRVVVVAATNRADILDAALLRSGRFDRRIRIGELAREQRVAVLEIHTRNKKLGEDVDSAGLAARTAGFSGADLECLVNEAGLLAVRRSLHASDGRSEVVLSMEDFEEALAPRGSARQRFDKVDSLLLESTTQLACPTGKAMVRLTLVGGTQVEGELEWADAAFVKLRGRGAGESAIVPKHQIITVETLEGTEGAADADVLPDRSAARTPGLA
jgi:SpoVK/Ycf46/Vps4 family AAA+-type ATPase